MDKYMKEDVFYPEYMNHKLLLGLFNINIVKRKA